MRQKRTRYSPELAEAVCRKVAAGASLEGVATLPDMPGLTSLYRWRRELPEFGAQLEAARRTRCERALAGALEEAGRIGAPEAYTPELGRKVCELIMAGLSTKQLMERRDLPHITTIRRWLGKHPEFRELYISAVQVRAEVLGDEVLQIADAADGRDQVMKARLQVDVRKWRHSTLMAARAADPASARKAGKPQSYEEALRELLRQDAELRARKAREGR